VLPAYPKLFDCPTDQNLSEVAERPAFPCGKFFHLAAQVLPDSKAQLCFPTHPLFPLLEIQKFVSQLACLDTKTLGQVGHHGRDVEDPASLDGEDRPQRQT